MTDRNFIILWIVFVSGFPRSRGVEDFYNETFTQRSISRDLSDRIIEGVEVPIETHPFVALMTMYEDIKMKICGGSVISQRVILTAAHCITNVLNGLTIPAKYLKVYLGSSVILRGDKYDVCAAVQHEKYNFRDPVEYYFYDIGLVLLQNNIRFGQAVKMIEIAPHWRWRNDRYWFTVAGFGKTTNFSMKRNRRRRRVLKATRMQFVAPDTCRMSPTFKNQQMPVPNHMFCMISDKWSSDCYGDSGSGVVWKGYLVGLVCIGRTLYCGSDSVPSMYTDAVYFRSWVQEKVSGLERLPMSQCR